MRKRHNITIDEKTWEQALQQYGKGNISRKIEELLSQDLDTDPEPRKEHGDIISHTNLTDKQRKLLEEIIRRELGTVSTNKAAKICNNLGIYTERCFIKKAVEKISKDNYAPYKLENGDLQSQQIQCGCGQTVYPAGLAKTGGECVGCGKQLIDLNSDDAGFSVG